MKLTFTLEFPSSHTLVISFAPVEVISVRRLELMMLKTLDKTSKTEH